jgi:sulfur carrier protein
MKITVNGSPQQLETNNVNISELLKIHNITKPEMVSVQLNGNFVNRESFQETLIEENDEVDFLYFMGGGQA